MGKLIPLFLLLLSCTPKHKPETHSNDIEDLQTYFDAIYRDTQNELDPETGWIDLEDCDGTLWNGLACSLGMPVKIDLAEFNPGEIHRRPYKACYTLKDGDLGSKSTISRDMLTGYMACLYTRKDLEGLKRLAKYGEARVWIMGEPKEMVSRVFLSGNLTGLLGRAIYALSEGENDKLYRHTPTSYKETPGYEYKDFERHVQVQGILLQGEASGSITPEMLGQLTEHANHDPEDVLFQAALGKYTGNQTAAIKLLLSEPPCPSYARGKRPDMYCQIGWLQAAKIVLEGVE